MLARAHALGENQEGERDRRCREESSCCFCRELLLEWPLRSGSSHAMTALFFIYLSLSLARSYVDINRASMKRPPGTEELYIVCRDSRVLRIHSLLLFFCRCCYVYLPVCRCVYEERIGGKSGKNCFNEKGADYGPGFIGRGDSRSLSLTL